MATVAGSSAVAGRTWSPVNTASEYIPPPMVISASMKITAMVLMISVSGANTAKTGLTSRRKRDFLRTVKPRHDSRIAAGAFGIGRFRERPARKRILKAGKWQG
jgi:hypothetical protein